jgi:vacuolar-type H+-ATPase subunit C/Vma6
MSACRAFAYAKATGIIARSFVESRLSRLSAVSSLRDFTALVLERELSAEAGTGGLERALAEKALKEILSVVNSFQNAPELLVRLIKSYEYADLKNALSALDKGEAAPAVCDLGRFSSIRFSAYPDLRRMLRGTEYAFLLNGNGRNKMDGERERVVLLDTHYWTALVDAARRLNRAELPRFRHILAEEIALMNCSWALRLRSYYGMDAETIRAALIGGKLEKSGPPLDRDALSSLERPLDHREDWQDWRRAAFLNPETPGTYWKCEPRFFQNAASVYLYHLTRRAFRRHPFSLDTAACFIRLKQFEEQLLCGVAEGLKLSLRADSVFTIMGGLL